MNNPRQTHTMLSNGDTVMAGNSLESLLDWMKDTSRMLGWDLIVALDGRKINLGLQQDHLMRLSKGTDLGGISGTVDIPDTNLSHYLTGFRLASPLLSFERATFQSARTALSLAVVGGTQMLVDSAQGQKTIRSLTALDPLNGSKLTLDIPLEANEGEVSLNLADSENLLLTLFRTPNEQREAAKLFKAWFDGLDEERRAFELGRVPDDGGPLMLTRHIDVRTQKREPSASTPDDHQNGAVLLFASMAEGGSGVFPGEGSGFRYLIPDDEAQRSFSATGLFSRALIYRAPFGNAVLTLIDDAEFDRTTDADGALTKLVARRGNLQVPAGRYQTLELQFEFDPFSLPAAQGALPLTVEFTQNLAIQRWQTTFSMPFEYTCIETLLVDEQPVRTIERTFNQFHLQTEEKTTQNNNVQTVQTSYFLEPVPFPQQPAYCQLPKEVKTAWSVLGTSRYREEIVSNTYDIHGNPLTHQQANGVVETSTWYPAADANDFVRYIKDRTVTPAPSPDGQAPTLRTHYTYKALPPVAGSSLPSWHTQEQERLVQVQGSNETELQRTTYTHFNTPDDAFLHGRVQRQTVTLNGKSSFVDYQYQRFDSPQLQVPVQQTTETLSTDFDDASRFVIRQNSLLTAHELLNLVDDVETRYYYDAMNRLTCEIIAPGTEFEARRNYEYTLSMANGQQVEHVIINAKNIRTRILFDGLGREVFEERDHVDSGNPNRPRQTKAALYNAWGNLSEQTVYDWLEGRSLALTTRFEYDDWAQQCTEIGPDGVEAHQSIDPIGTDEWKGPIQRSWRQASGPSPLVSGQDESWLNLFAKPSQTRELDATGQELSIQTYNYDGLGRCTQQRDPNKRITEFTYDAWSRMTSSTLPDKSIVKREYAAHSTSDLPVALRVSGDGMNYTLVGEQEFDGLERLVRLTTGKQTERYAYDGGRMQVSRKITPANQTIVYDYNLTLTEQPIASRAPDEIVDFTYEKTSARLIRASNEQGTQEYDYNTSNQLRDERWVDNLGKTWQTLYSNSIQDRPLKRTDLKQQGSDGLDTVHHYDAFGRVARIDQGRLQALFEYDGLGQLAKTTTKDLGANSTLVTELKYDDLGRETLRTQTLDQQPPRTQESQGATAGSHQRCSRSVLCRPISREQYPRPWDCHRYQSIRSHPDSRAPCSADRARLAGPPAGSSWRAVARR